MCFCGFCNVCLCVGCALCEVLVCVFVDFLMCFLCLYLDFVMFGCICVVFKMCCCEYFLIF